jgi:3-hydroxyacyl-CoA dehydrogenase
MVVAGNLGRKAGTGFYQYNANSKEATVADYFVK